MATQRRFHYYLVISIFVLLSSCAPSQIGGMPTSTPLYTQSQTMNLEDSDRIARFQRLADEEGIEPPTVEQIYAPAGTVPGLSGPVPVVRVSFDEGVFFDTDQDTPLPDSLAVLNLIAQNMERDVPDAALTIIGNTDSTGTDAYNDNLSERRAIHVMKLLTEDGLDPLQMTTVAVGDRQPVAPNSTIVGRARNRRVEFLISASVQANLAAVQYQSVDPSYFPTSVSQIAPARPTQATVTVLQPHPVKVAGTPKLALIPVGPMQIEQAIEAPAPDIAVHDLAPAPTVSMREIQNITPAKLTNVLVY